MNIVTTMLETLFHRNDLSGINFLFLNLGLNMCPILTSKYERLTH